MSQTSSRRQVVLPGLGNPPAPPRPPREAWIARIQAELAAGDSGRITAEDGLRLWPADPDLLHLAMLAALIERRPARALALFRRAARQAPPGRAANLLHGLAVAQTGDIAQAWTILNREKLLPETEARAAFVGGAAWLPWLTARLRDIRAHAPRAAARPPAPQLVKPEPAPAPAPVAPSLPRLDVELDIAFDFADSDRIALSGDDMEATFFRLRGELVRLSLFEGFDELLCLPALRGVEPHWYQIETVRRVLKQYRGRVLLADEVGLGKTVEAGMVLKEYMLRGMAERILILTPASLVGQWRDEMAAKFGIDCATTHDPLLKSDPDAFWRQPIVIASIALARRKEQAEMLAGLSYDAVVVDEAHHLRDQASASYRLVGALQKRFLLLLSATPVQNSLLELYNLLTLLQPGIFKTQKEFRAAYMVPGKPREPANRDRLRDLMRGVMVRNTRALAALRMPRRHASTLRAAPEEAEAACYAELTALVRQTTGAPRLALQHLLAAAGSSPAAAAAAIQRFAERSPGDARWPALARRYAAIPKGAKEAALLRLLAQNPEEKKLVFIHHRDSMTHVAASLRRAGRRFALFAGDLSGPEKDAAVAAFRDDVPLLLCTESGGEGRNLQFCNTLINFDIPWNPMAIEQRIGRIDRIGQTREVFVFNLVASGTIEDAMLRMLDEKINMFELVVGEVGAILGEIDEQQDFSSLLLEAWLEATEQGRADALARLEAQLLAARQQYDGVKSLDEALFGQELDAA
jgi:superfamily II DNA or RNA helicase